MTPFRFEELLTVTQAEMTSIMSDKNKEYARSDSDRLENFKRRGEYLGLDPISVLSVDLQKHLDAINSFIVRNRSASHVQLNDPINRRILDAINYLFLLRCLIEDAAVKTELTSTGKLEA